MCYASFTMDRTVTTMYVDDVSGVGGGAGNLFFWFDMPPISSWGELNVPHLKGETLCHEHAFTIFETLVCESYYTGRHHMFTSLTKSDFYFIFKCAVLTLVMEEARDIVHLL